LIIRGQNDTKVNLFKIEQSQNIVIDGIVVRDSSFWNTLVYRSDMVTIQNYKMINCRPTTTTFNNTEGVDFDESTNGKLTNAFLYTGDDSMATKNEEASGTTRTTSSTTRSSATATPSAPRSGPRPWARRSTASYSGTSTSSRRDAP
jgi:polygalacturonase